MSISYKDSGVDRDKGDLFVERIRNMVKTTYGPEVKSGVGGFASLFDTGDGRLLAAGCDGVGTKLKVANILNQHDTIGIDLVAMCVNDVICTGARPLFFLDYFATGKLELSVSEAVVKGIVAGCRESKMALVGGETAEMPGMYAAGEYDLAGFCVGEVLQADLIDGSKLESGDELVVLESSGLHSNGFSLIRKLFPESDRNWLVRTLTPTRIYVGSIMQVLRSKQFAIKGFAHITGSGFLNVPRINGAFNYKFSQLPPLTDLYLEIQKRSGLSLAELYSTFNMGIGFVVAVKKGQAAALAEELTKLGERAYVAGSVAPGKSQIEIYAQGKKVTIE